MYFLRSNSKNDNSLLAETMKVRRKWNGTFKTAKEKKKFLTCYKSIPRKTLLEMKVDVYYSKNIYLDIIIFILDYFFVRFLREKLVAVFSFKLQFAYFLKNEVQIKWHGTIMVCNVLSAPPSLSLFAYIIYNKLHRCLSIYQCLAGTWETLGIPP